MPPENEWDERLRSVLHALYLIFNEGYTPRVQALHRADLAREAIRLTRAVLTLLPRDGEVAGTMERLLLRNPSGWPSVGLLVQPGRVRVPQRAVVADGLRRGPRAVGAPGSSSPLPRAGGVAII
ncbi:DUF6596 domain-containing protein [Spirillospora sp. NPDC048911]|uniref:DUF6596 domain-containing protein n=1 Tax=Spirillospora sp. NPDC048911 TaxID=3364527 RepID=UPI00371DE679